jgi:hypothetical protein
LAVYGNDSGRPQDEKMCRTLYLSTPSKARTPKIGSKQLVVCALSILITLDKFYAFNVSYELLARIECPNLNSTQGIGIMATVINARRLVAQPIPSL